MGPIDRTEGGDVELILGVLPAAVAVSYALAMSWMRAGRDVPVFRVATWALAACTGVDAALVAADALTRISGMVAILTGAMLLLVFCIILAGGCYWVFGRAMARDLSGTLASLYVTASACAAVIALGLRLAGYLPVF
jgi:hypothetical protein